MYDPREFCCKKCLTPVDTKYAECGPGGPIDYGVCPECGYTSSVWSDFMLVDPMELEYQRHEAKMQEEEEALQKKEFEFFLNNHCDMRCLDEERGCQYEWGCEKYEKTFDR